MRDPDLIRRFAFTLVELLTVVAVIGVLVAMILPALSAARERAAVVRVCAELRQIGDALEGYAYENYDRFPPARTWCDTDKLHHWCELPEELVTFTWLPKGESGSFLSSAVEDIFNPGHTYKYAAPGLGYHNNAMTIKSLWVPDDFPRDDPNAAPETLPGKSYDNFSVPGDGAGTFVECPVKWVIYSVGPRYHREQGLPKRYPVARCSWYRGYGTRGVIPRIRTREGRQIGWH